MCVCACIYIYTHRHTMWQFTDMISVVVDWYRNFQSREIYNPVILNLKVMHSKFFFGSGTMRKLCIICFINKHTIFEGVAPLDILFCIFKRVFFKSTSEIYFPIGQKSIFHKNRNLLHFLEEKL